MRSGARRSGRLRPPGRGGAALDPAVGAAAAKPDAVDPRVLDPAIRQGHMPGAVGHDHGGDADGRLAVAVPLGREQVAAVAEGQALERQVLDESARLGLPLDLKEGVGDRGDDLSRSPAPHPAMACTSSVPSRARNHSPGLVEGPGDILEDVPLIRPPGEERPRGRAGQDHDTGLVIDRGDPVPRGLPRVEDHHVDVAELLGESPCKGSRSSTRATNARFSIGAVLPVAGSTAWFTRLSM